MARQDKTIEVFEVLYHSADPRQAHAGAAGDGSFIARFRKRADAESFARGKEAYGQPARVQSDSVPLRIARRWGIA